MAKAPKDLTKVNPEELQLNQLTKQNMLDYVKAIGTREDKDFFKALVKECYQGEEDNRLKKGNDNLPAKVKRYDMSKMRREFAKRFFPVILKPKKVNSSSWEEDIENL